jgi:hypothetical protein
VGLIKVKIDLENLLDRIRLFFEDLRWLGHTNQLRYREVLGSSVDCTVRFIKTLRRTNKNESEET